VTSGQSAVQGKTSHEGVTLVALAEAAEYALLRPQTSGHWRQFPKVPSSFTQIKAVQCYGIARPLRARSTRLESLQIPPIDSASSGLNCALYISLGDRIVLSRACELKAERNMFQGLATDEPNNIISWIFNQNWLFAAIIVVVAVWGILDLMKKLQTKTLKEVAQDMTDTRIRLEKFDKFDKLTKAEQDDLLNHITEK
jgi:hypothetical protein